MKNLKFFLLAMVAVFAFNSHMFAQTGIVVTEGTENIGGANNPVFSVYIEGIDSKKIIKAWKAMFEDRKGKIETSKNDISVSNVVFPVLSTAPIAVLSRIIEDKSGVKILAAFNVNGQFVASSRMPAETESVKKIMYDFVLSVKKAALQEKLDESTKELEKLQSKGKDLVSKKEGLEKDIQSYNEKIKQAEKDIQETIQLQAENKSKTESQVKVVEELKTKMNDLK